MSDITSGYNIAKNIYFKPGFNDLCGFREAEIKPVIEQIANQCGFKKDKADEALDLMRTYYNGHVFSFEKNGFFKSFNSQFNKKIYSTIEKK